MSKIQVNTNTLWDIGKTAERIQNETYQLASQLKFRADTLDILEDILQWSDEKIKSEANQMKRQADRCGLAASYIFKIAENYEQAENNIKSALAHVNVALSNLRTVHDEIYKEKFPLTDEEKMNKALNIEYSQQNSDEAGSIPYPGGDRNEDGRPDLNSTAKTSACGSFAMLHALRYLSKSKGLTIREICKIAVDSGARPFTTSGGTNIIELGKALSEKGYDVTVEKSGYEDSINALKDGNVVISSFPGNRFHNWGSGGHFVLIADISEDGQRVLIIDSDTRNLKYDDDGDGIYWVSIDLIKSANSRYVIS